MARLPLALSLAVALVLAAAPPAWAGFDDAARDLDQKLQGGDYRAQVDAVRALIKTGDARAVQVVIDKVFGFRDQFVFENALTSLRTDSSPEQKAALVEATRKTRSNDVRVILLKVVGRLGDVSGVDEVIEGALGDREWTVQVAAVRAARDRGSKRMIGAMIAQLPKAEGRVFEDIRAAVKELTGADLGDRAEDWERWWASAKDQVEPGKAEDEPKGDEKHVQVGTLSREPLYEVRSTRALFIVDISGSMDTGTDLGTRLEIVKRELGRVFESQLDQKAQFNVMVYNEKVQLWKKGVVKATTSNKKSAMRMVQKLEAGGLTATYDALKTAFDLEGIDTIYFLSDGVPSVGDQTITDVIRSEVRTWNRSKGIVVHSIAFLAGENPQDVQDKPYAIEFMRELAKENGGTFKLVE